MLKTRFILMGLLVLLLACLVGSTFAFITTSQPIKLYYDNGSYVNLPAGVYSSWNKISNVWYVNGVVYSPPLTVPSPLWVLPPNTNFIISSLSNFNIAYKNGEALDIQDVAQQIIVSFQVTSGAWEGTGNLNVTSAGGAFQFTATTTGSLQITASNTLLYFTVNGQLAANPISFNTGYTYLILWQYTQTMPPPIIIGNINTVLYFRSDAYTTYNITANGLDTTNTNQPELITDTITPSQTVTYGFRMWILHQMGSTTELTSGTPDALITRSTDGAGWQNATWLAPQTTLSIGFDALQVTTYISKNNGATWTAKATYITHPLLSSQILHQTWTFNLYTTRNATINQASFAFGSNAYNSNINGVGLQPPTATEWQTWRFLTGDYIGFILSAYTDQIGVAAYLLFLLIPTTSLYLRHRNLGPVIVMFGIFGGSGGVIWLFVPPWAAIGVDILLVLGASFLVWRIIK